MLRSDDLSSKGSIYNTALLSNNMKDNIKNQLDIIRRNAIAELDSFIVLTRTVIDLNRYTIRDYANNYIVNLYELSDGVSLSDAADMCDDLTKADYDSVILPVLSGCKRIAATLATFYCSSLPSYLEQLQSTLENNEQIALNTLTSFLAVTQALQNQLKQI